MFVRKSRIALILCGALLSLSPLPSLAKSKQRFTPATPLTAEQAALIDKALAREKTTIKELQKRAPIVQTYIQNMKPDAELYAVPVSDDYIISRVDFGKTFNAKDFQEKTAKKGFFRGSMKAITGLGKALHFENEYVSTGFMDMMFIDPINFNKEHYDFAFVRREFLGSVRTFVFDVSPKPGDKPGSFLGRIWIEDQDGNIVRSNGTFTGNHQDEAAKYFHFDSWRMNLQPDLWLPVAIYVEDSQKTDSNRPFSFRAQTYFWGYSLKLPTSQSDNATIQVENATDQSENSQDVGPLEAQHTWVSQAEHNVLDRLVQAGLLAPVSDFDKVLETVTNNLIIGSNMVLPGEVHCRVLLTAPLESLAVGDTILLSKGLVDVLPSEEDLAAVISFQLAHIALGHHVDTRYAFNDRLLFPDQSTFERINMVHDDRDNEAAAKKSLEILKASVYKDKMQSAALFFSQLTAREKQLPALVTPRLGDSLLRKDGTPWMGDLAKMAPKLDVNNLTQIAALPLGSHLKIDPWDDKVYSLNARPAVILNPRDKMPMEVTPVFLRLSRYAPPASQTMPASVPATQPAQTTGTSAPPPDQAPVATTSSNIPATSAPGPDGAAAPAPPQNK
ncbi:MAG TPA: hypothetical protein VGD64_07105 [Acidisarcina sp.]